MLPHNWAFACDQHPAHLAVCSKWEGCRSVPFNAGWLVSSVISLRPTTLASAQQVGAGQEQQFTNDSNALFVAGLQHRICRQLSVGDVMWRQLQQDSSFIHSLLPVLLVIVLQT